MEVAARCMVPGEDKHHPEDSLPVVDTLPGAGLDRPLEVVEWGREPEAGQQGSSPAEGDRQSYLSLEVAAGGRLKQEGQ